MNRGKHEGEVGISFYKYIADNNTLEEECYVPARKSYQMLRQDMGNLSYVNENNLCYLMIGSSIYAIDLSGKEYVVVVETIEADNIVVRDDSKRIAWAEMNKESERSEIFIMNLETGEKQTITAKTDESLKVLGFVDEDFIYGIARDSDMDRAEERMLLYAVEIIGSDQVVQNHYEKSGVYITGVSIQETLIHLDRVSFTEDNKLQVIAGDILIRNEKIETGNTVKVSGEKSGREKMVYYIKLKDNVSGDRSLAVTAPQEILLPEIDNTMDILIEDLAIPRFYSYSYGRLAGIYSDPAKAIQAVYEDMGTVTDSKQSILWWRSRKALSKNLELEGVLTYSSDKRAADLLAEAYPDKTILDVSGCSLNQVLVFVSEGRTVAAIGEAGEIFVITGYDRYNVTLLNLATGNKSKMGLNDGEAYFSKSGNQFYTYTE